MKKDGRFKKGQHWREPKPHWNRDWLYENYITNKHTIPELAEMCGCTDSNITYWIVKHKIPFRSLSETRKIKYWGSKGAKNGMYGRNGDKNPRWKGGISPERQKFYLSKEWQYVVPIVFKRDEYKCQRCGAHHLYKMPLHIHHKVSFAIKELRANIDNLILLCKSCHDLVHSKKNTDKEFILTYEQFKQLGK